MERAINYSLQVSKEIKTKTKLSSGTVSVSYAAIEIIKERLIKSPIKIFCWLAPENLEIILPKIYKITYQERAFHLQTEPMKRHLNLAKFYDARFYSL